MEATIQRSQTTQGGVSLELLLARDITPLLSVSNPDLPYAKASGEHTFAAPSLDSNLLLPNEFLPKDITVFVGVMGMTIDQNTGHIWWSYNHGGHYIHEMDALFRHVQSHEPKKQEPDFFLRKLRDEEEIPVSENFRDICFTGEGSQYNGFILDSWGGYFHRSRSAVHILQMPGFAYQQTVSLLRNCAEYIVPHNGMLLLCDHDTIGGSGTNVSLYDPETNKEIGHFRLEKIGSLFSANGILQGICQESFTYGNSEKTKYTLVTIDNSGKGIRKKPLATTNFASGRGYLDRTMLRHPSGILFFAGYGQLANEKNYERTLEIFAPDGTSLAATHIPYSLHTACFDAEGNLVGLAIVYDEQKRVHLMGVKYAVHYDSGIIPLERDEMQETKPRLIQRVKSLFGF